jgi:hypothetical protein
MTPGYGGFGFGFGGRGRGFRGRGRGWAFGAGYPAGPVQTQPVTVEQELDGLKQQAGMLQNTLTQINERIEQLQK